MKTQLYLSLLLIILFSTTLSAVQTTGTLEKANVENLAKVKKKPVKRFLNKLTQRVFENKLIKKFSKEGVSENSENKNDIAFLSIILSGLALLIPISLLLGGGTFLALLLTPFLGLAGFILGIIGSTKEKRKTLSIIGIFLGILVAVFSCLFLLSIL